MAHVWKPLAVSIRPLYSRNNLVTQNPDRRGCSGLTPSYLGCLSKTEFVSEREEGVVALQPNFFKQIQSRYLHVQIPVILWQRQETTAALLTEEWYLALWYSVSSWWDELMDWSLMVDPLTYFSFKPVLHNLYNTILSMVLKEPLLLIGKRSPCRGNLSGWSITICQHHITVNTMCWLHC